VKLGRPSRFPLGMRNQRYEGGSDERGGVRPIHSSLSAGEPRTQVMISSHGGEGIGVMNGLVFMPQADTIGRVNVQHRGLA